MMRFLSAVALLIAALPTSAQNDLTSLRNAAAAALAEDRARLERVRTRSAADLEAAAAAAARLQSDEALIERLVRDRAAAEAEITELAARRAALDDESELIGAVALSVAEDQIARLRRAPLTAEDPDRVAQLAALTQSGFSLDRLYELWRSLHQELADAAEVSKFDATVVFVDGLPRPASVQRAGALALVADGRPAQLQASGTIIETRSHAADYAIPGVDALLAPGLALLAPNLGVRGDADRLAQRLHDAGLIGWLIVICGLIALLLSAYLCIAWTIGLRNTGVSGYYGRRLTRALAGAQLVDAEDLRTHLDHFVRRQSLRIAGKLSSLRIFARAAVLLGLLGTVVGMIQTFNVLRLYGGGDMRLAAAGIAQALSTTWLGLSVAIGVTFVYAGLAALARRLQDTLRERAHALAVAQTPALPSQPTAPDARASRRAAPRAPGHALSVAAALAVGFGLFWLMQRLTVGRIELPNPIVPVTTIERIPLPRQSAPPEPPALAPLRRDLAVSPGALSFNLPVAPATIAAVQPQLPALGAAPALTGVPEGRSVLAGLGDGTWIGTAAGTAPFDGADLVPLTSAQPKYPRSAVNQDLEGEVELIFKITAAGRVTDIKILRAHPRGVFEEAAAAALAQWLYPPFYRDGQPRARQATQLFEFRIADAQELYIYEDGS